MKYEIIVVGGGHAGCEASLASARKGHNTLLITSNIANIADTPCNPSIGGPAKGIVVREIDSLGGEMAKNTDKSLLQIKMLNTKKGVAVQALRAQIDKVEYHNNMLSTLQKTKGLTLVEGMVEDLIIKNNSVIGIKLDNGISYFSKKTILTTGTYLRSSVLVGSNKISSGPHGEKPSKNLSNKLKEYGFTIQRLKTGTPPRLEKKSVDFTKLSLQVGDNIIRKFSYYGKKYYNIKEQESCYLAYTNEDTHSIIRENLKKSSMYGGFVEGIGPRYCPSIEDKVVKFSDKDRHQLFLEPESKYYDDLYLQGFSTSMPEEIQEKMVHSIAGLENVRILKYAYAIEYDSIDPLQLKPTLETKVLKNLYTAGQINGTSGYEEAACQGLIAGLNATLSIEKRKPLILKRNEAYIGVLIDDLVTKGTKEPYRLLTSRAEHRLLLRNDNADYRLTPKGYRFGLVNNADYKKFKQKYKEVAKLKMILKKKYLVPKNKKEIALLKLQNYNKKTSYYNLLKRSEISIKNIVNILKLDYSKDVRDIVETDIKYQGYIRKAKKEAEKLLHYDKVLIPIEIDYKNIPNLATEARQKLELIKPISIGQASRISGVNPSDITVLLLYLKRRNHE